RSAPPTRPRPRTTCATSSCSAQRARSSPVRRTSSTRTSRPARSRCRSTGSRSSLARRRSRSSSTTRTSTTTSASATAGSTCAARVQEITQLDVELAFPDQEFLFDLMERMVSAVWRECIGVDVAAPFERMTFAEADRRYGSDKPDRRFGLEIEDATEATRGSQFGVFAGAPCVRYLTAPQAFSRTELERLEQFAKEWGAKGLAYLVYDEEGEVRSPIAKFLSEPELEVFRSDPGTTVLFAADTWPMTSRVLGAVRTHLGETLGLIDEDAWSWLWITDFPMFEWDEEEQRWGAVHHPFTRPTPEWEGRF